MRPGLKIIRRTAVVSFALPCLYLGTASATFLYRIHRENGARLHVRLPAATPVTSDSRILVFAPHCDDETLGCAGLLQQAAKAGAPATVAMITNGDGFRVAVETQLRTVHVTPADYVRFAAVRQEESWRALEKLGVPRERVLFLGYPDRGLMPMWNDFWSADRPYTSPYTGQDHSPYAVAFRPGACYCGESVLTDVRKVIERARPTDLYVTHPSDDHPDHSAASSFVTLALRRLRDEGVEWANQCRLHYYIVHRGDWPVPQGLQKDDPLVPPSEMLGLDTRWCSAPLSPQETDRKEQAVLAYPSQTAVMKRFLLSFARRSELYGDLDPVSVRHVADGAVRVDGDPAEWKAVRPAELDPVNDNLLRDFQAGGDVRAIYACRDSENLYLRVDTYQPVSDRVRFTLRMRTFGAGGRTGTFLATLRPPGSVTPSGLKASVRGRLLEMAIPLRQLGDAKSAALSVESTFAGLQVDRTGYRFLDL